jgi:peptide/nickel transport system permease protein
MTQTADARLSARQITRRRRLAAARRVGMQFRQRRSGMLGLGILVFFVIVALAAPLLANSSGLDVTKANGPLLGPPSSKYWLGTDENGRSVLTLLIWGARISLFVGLMATLISMVIGTVLGLVSGYFGSWIGRITFRLTEWFLVIPFLPLAIVLCRSRNAPTSNGPGRSGPDAGTRCRSTCCPM